MAKKESKNENKVKKHFFKDFKAELKKVIWPTPKQLINNTIAVVTIVLITAVIVFILDALFDLGNKYGITKLQSIVNEKFNSQEEQEQLHDHDHDHDHGEETVQENTEKPVENNTAQS
jgi:preprotein translocase SecE subunit